MLSRVLFVCVVLCVRLVQAGSYPCDWESPDGSYFDLSSLTLSGSDYTFTDVRSGYAYKANICGLVQTDPSCSGKNGNFCWYQAQSLKLVAAKETEPTPTWSMLDATNPAKGIRVSFHNGDIYMPGGPGTRGTIPQVNLDFQCKPVADKFQVNYDTVNIVFTVVFPTPAACPTSRHSSSSSTSTSLSGGWIFIIIFLVSTWLYVVIGCAFKYKKQGTRGVESCPNIDFWRDIPSLVKEGCIFTYVRIRGCFGGGGGHVTATGGVEKYETI